VEITTLLAAVPAGQITEIHLHLHAGWLYDFDASAALTYDVFYGELDESHG